MKEEIIGLSKVNRANKTNSLRIIIPERIGKFLNVTAGDSIAWYLAETTDENGNTVKILTIKKAMGLERL
ncbi:MAG: hypothetical protein JRN26_05475 [Nitrososphaerota archaeon]|jgi:GTP cyclohydrolase I|nr:hypothetical protein [Nitrososphaerota archaeon]MDG6927175.1 hypothetical protein [Nitrososphaerota archaeon]MDG6930837.1 hypothetical protein [Nitrososphaerota archaeon]MDG6932281.1 hypothetical protein [Nitrososphaerota archaeon]MDG6936314.1 hypothetical protein [Nitrososphaerota archaeon]